MTAKHRASPIRVKVVPFFNTPLCVSLYIHHILFRAATAAAAAAIIRFVHKCVVNAKTHDTEIRWEFLPHVTWSKFECQQAEVDGKMPNISYFHTLEIQFHVCVCRIVSLVKCL